MPRKPIAVEKDYAVGPGTIRLTVIVGDRQYGSSMVFVGKEMIANGDIDEIPLGEGPDLIGKRVSVYTVVTDVRNKRTDMSVTWVLTGGAENLRVEKDATTAKKFGSQMFKAVFDLTSAE
jgi:hypothetical protein